MEHPKPIPAPSWESAAQGRDALPCSPGGSSGAGGLCLVPCLSLRAEDSSARQASRFSLQAPNVSSSSRSRPVPTSLYSSSRCRSLFLLSIFLPLRHPFPPGWIHSRPCALLLHFLLSTLLCPFWGSPESCWEKPLGRILVEQKLLTSSLVPSHGGTVKFSKAAHGWESSWCWVMPSGKSTRTCRKMTGRNSLEVILKYASVLPALTIVTTAT